MEKGNIKPTKNQAGIFDDALTADITNDETVNKSPAAKNKSVLNSNMRCFFLDKTNESVSFFSKLLFHKNVINLAVNIIE